MVLSTVALALPLALPRRRGVRPLHVHAGHLLHELVIRIARLTVVTSRTSSLSVFEYIFPKSFGDLFLRAVLIALPSGQEPSKTSNP